VNVTEPTSDSVRDRIVAACDAYVAALDSGDVESAVACFAPDATQEEPAGSLPNVGTDAIRAFFESRRSRIRVRRCSPVTVVGYRAVFQIHVVVDDGAVELVSSDVVELDDQYRFRSIVAFPDRHATLFDRA